MGGNRHSAISAIRSCGFSPFPCRSKSSGFSGLPNATLIRSESQAGKNRSFGIDGNHLAQAAEKASDRVAGMTRESLVVYETSTGQQYRFGAPGPSVREEEWMECLKQLQQTEPKPKFVVVSLGAAGALMAWKEGSVPVCWQVTQETRRSGW